MKKTTQLIIALLAVFSLGARELYVSPSGKNSNPGTKQAPVATLQAAIAKARPGDVVKIAPGVYREQVNFRKSGKKGAPITFAGTRGKNGEFLTIFEAPGVTVDKWVPAPEIAPNVWKAKLADRPDLMMMDGKMIAFINKSTMALPRWKELPKEMEETSFWGKFGPGCKRIPGFDLMSLDKDIWVRHRYFGKRKEQFWPVINYVLSGWSKGYLYVRFANGDKPQNHQFTASRGAGFILTNVSHLHFRDLHMRGSRYQFHLRGNSFYNTIENCLLMHGGARVRIDGKAKYTTVKNSVLTAGFTQNKLFKLRSAEDMRGGLLYLIFKYIIGHSSSDDIGINDRGSHTRILNNIIIQGLIGMDAYGPHCEVRDNVVREMSSVGICTGAKTSGIFTGNLVMNCGIPLRIHNLRGEHGKREEYHFRNLFVQNYNGGGQVYVHCESHRWGPDMINFEKGTRTYKKNPPAPVETGKIYIYHNTFWGGNDFSPGFTVRYLSQRFRQVMPFFFVNNVMKFSHRFDIESQELLNNNLFYTFNPKVKEVKLRFPAFVKFNKIIDVQPTKDLWNAKGIPGLPDMTLKAGSPALACGIDISKPFTAQGKKFAAFPGFKPGYFKGKAPAAGAFQQGESQKKFFDMHRKTEQTIAFIEGLSKKK